MEIINHRLFKKSGDPYAFVESPNRSRGLKPEYLVIHYTAGRNAKETIEWFMKSEAASSAHLVIGKDGSITQLVSFDEVAWHAGVSSWEDRVGLNKYSIGIELDNAGSLKRHGSRWIAWFGDEYDDDEVIEAVHKNESVPRGWNIYPPDQIEAAVEVGSLLVNHYGLRDVVGHDDIAPTRKTDPGPAFSMDSYRARLMGRKVDQETRFVTTTHLNIRSGPGTQFDTISGKPLPPGTSVEILDRAGTWAQVDVLDDVGGIMDLQGWVHMRYLKRTE